MKFYILPALVVCFVSSVNAESPTPVPLDVVMQRMHALNEHDLDAFLATYAEDVEIFVYPDRPLGKGKAHVKKIFAPMIRKGSVRVKVDRTMTADSYVVAETTTSFGGKAEPTVSVYEVRDGLIRSVRFLRDTIRAKQQKASAGSE